MITLEDVKDNPEVKEIINNIHIQSQNLKHTEHSLRHANVVSNSAGKILQELGYDEQKVEFAKIVGYLHDMGNIVNTKEHPQTGAVLAYNILKDSGIDIKQRTEIMCAIGKHEEQTEKILNDISAALIIADKSDVCRDRVINKDIEFSDKVNYAVTNADLLINSKEEKVTLNLTIDEHVCSILEYFETFVNRAIFCKKAAEYLKLWFELVINDTKIL